MNVSQRHGPVPSWQCCTVDGVEVKDPFWIWEVVKLSLESALDFRAAALCMLKMIRTCRAHARLWEKPGHAVKLLGHWKQLQEVVHDGLDDEVFWECGLLLSRSFLQCARGFTERVLCSSWSSSACSEWLVYHLESSPCLALPPLWTEGISHLPAIHSSASSQCLLLSLSLWGEGETSVAADRHSAVSR